jgi:hypothetical protein
MTHLESSTFYNNNMRGLAGAFGFGLSALGFGWTGLVKWRPNPEASQKGSDTGGAGAYAAGVSTTSGSSKRIADLNSSYHLPVV